MRRIVTIYNRFAENKLLQKGLQPSYSVSYFKEKMFIQNIHIFALVCLLVYVPESNNLIISGDWNIFWITTVSYSIFLSLLFFNNLSVTFKAIIISILIYCMGLSYLIILGQKGSGIVWLLGFSITATVFLEIRGAVVSLFINIITLAGFGIVIKFNLEDIPLVNTFTLREWINYSLNVLLVNGLVSISLAFLISGLEETLCSLEELKEKLRRKSERLIKAKEKAEESDQLKSSFLSNISHEFRTPLNAILGFTEIMLYTHTEEDKRTEYLLNIQKSGEQLLQIISNTIEYSRIELGTIDLNVKEIEIDKFLSEIHEQLQFQLPHGLAFRNINQINGDHIIIFSDGQKLTQVFTNLISNAFKFTYEGEVVFGLMESDNKAFIQFYIRDTGIGIQKEKQKHIFTRFYKEDDFKNGIGLGLSISATLVMHLGGRIWLESDTNAGTTFYFTIPVKISDSKS